MNEERRKILEMLAAGQLTAEEAERLLEALEGASAREQTPVKGRPARLLRIEVHDPEDEALVRINLPLALARFALKLVPKEQQEQIREAGFDLEELLDSLGTDVPEGRIVEVEGGKGEHIVIEVT